MIVLSSDQYTNKFLFGVVKWFSKVKYLSSLYGGLELYIFISISI
jgi:hypothetical protein